MEAPPPVRGGHPSNPAGLAGSLPDHRMEACVIIGQGFTAEKVGVAETIKFTMTIAHS